MGLSVPYPILHTGANSEKLPTSQSTAAYLIVRSKEQAAFDAITTLMSHAGLDCPHKRTQRKTMLNRRRWYGINGLICEATNGNLVEHIQDSVLGLQE